ncbi:MAG: hypothetical protein GC182_10525 [Rhodopseudomonas sp.]|nr:hypothetical protein [Rhodopseudomonas sp.]
MSLRALVQVVIAAVVIGGAARAATIEAVPLGKPGEGAIFIDGDIDYADREIFLSKISVFSSGVVILNSNGGNAFAGIEIGKTIRMRGFKTWVPSGSHCASACAIAWLGGTRRLMGNTARIGFHSVYKMEGGAPVETGAGNAMYGAYLGQLGLSDRAIYYLSNAAPTAMNWLTPAQAETFGIELAIFDPGSDKDKKQADAASPSMSAPSISAPAAKPAMLPPQVNAPPSPPKQQEATIAPAPFSDAPSPDVIAGYQLRARDFVIALHVLTSGPTDQFFRIVDGLYADQVLYFGKLTSRADVVTQLTKFIMRWPVRAYAARPDSIKVQCNGGTGECQVDGLVDFDAKSPERGQWSHGRATFSYLLAFHPGARWPVIVNENGAIVDRKLEALMPVNRPYGRDLGMAR